MKNTGNLFLVMYDITEPKILHKVAVLLQKSGYERINYSVWIGWQNLLTTTALNKQLKILIQTEKAKGSRLYCLPLSRQALAKITSITGKKPENLEYWLGTCNNLFFVTNQPTKDTEVI